MQIISQIITPTLSILYCNTFYSDHCK